MPETSWNQTSRKLALPVVVGVVLLVLAAATLVLAVQSNRDRVRAQREETEFEFLLAWADLVDGFESEYLTESLVKLDLAGPDDATAAAEDRRATEIASLAIFDQTAATDHEIGRIAEFISRNLREVQAETGDSPEDYYLAATTELWNVDRWGLGPKPDALLDAYVAYQLPILVETDRILGLANQQWNSLPPDAQQWFAAAPAAVASGFERWITDPSEPFAEFVDVHERLELALPTLFDEVIAITDSESFALLEASDAWIEGWSEHQGAAPPVSFDDLLDASSTVRSAMVDVADETAMQRSTVAANDAAVLQRRFWIYVLSAGLFAGVFLAIGASAYMRLDRKARRWRLDASTDSLTGLANSRVLDSRAGKLLADKRAGSDALVLVDLDRFKVTNDTYGHLFGDALLRIVAERLDAELTQWNGEHGRDANDTLLTRLGGDEFVVVIHDLDDLAKATELAERLRARVALPIVVNGRQTQTTLSAGVAFGAGDSALLDLRTEADIALSQAKRRGRDQVQVFDDPVVRSIVQKVHRGEAGPYIDAHLQAIYNLDRSYDYEMLARWIPEQGEPINASRWWLPVQQAGESRMLLDAMIKRVAAAFVVYPGFNGRMWLNVGPDDIGTRGDADRVLGAIEAADIDPARVGIEILETAPILELATTAANLRQLRSAGIQIALDDFGAGFTPLGHLVRLPIDVVKIDRSVVSGIDHNRKQAALVLAVVQAAHSLSLEVVAEGVERPAELHTLQDLGVRRMQGYLIHRPSKVSDLPPTFDFAIDQVRPAAARLAPQPGGD